MCGEPLGGSGTCVVCLLRAGLDQEQTEEESRPDAFAFEGFEINRREDGSLWELGRGAMGVTYRALDKSLHRSVALKVIDAPGQATGSGTVQDRFLREARAAAALRHPNVAGVFRFGTLSDRCYYAMELVEGETLEARVRRDGPLPVHLALEIAIQVTQALRAAAAHGLVHRDLKPGNIMLAHDPAAPAAMQAKVIDFGLAKATADTLGEMDLTHGGFVGTPTFASPEQFEGREVDPRSDIYSLGATLWYALTGLTACSGQTIEAIRNCQKHAALPVEQLVARKVPAPLIALLRRTLAAEPAQRPASARELMHLLQSLRRKLARRRTVTLVSLGLFLICAASLTSYLLQRRHAPVVMSPEKSVAVLPFENLSKDEANAFFAGGVQDEILSNLAKIADLKVISRTSVMEYKNASKRNLREIGKALGVSHFVEGSVQRVGDRIRVTAQLIDARTDNHLWADHYDRNVTDVFAIQSEIARQIADQLRSRLSSAERTALAEGPTADLKAYELYTTATAIDVWGDWRGAEKSMARKVELLEQTTQRDPSFVLAWCALAKTHCDLSGFDPAHHLELAKKAADAALQLRPDLGEVHRELARYYFHANDFAQAYEELTVALRTLPNDSETFRIAAETNRHRNRWDEAVANFQKARELDPRNDEVIYHLGGVYEEMRRYDDFEQLLTKADDNQPGPNPWSEMALAQIKLDKGDPVAAQALLAQVPLDFSPTYEIWGTRFTAALYLRDYDLASRVTAAMPAKFDVGVLHGLPTDGLVARFRGDKAKAETVFTAARKKFDAAWGDRSRDHRYFARVAAFDAGLGRKREAIEEARQAVELMPVAKDSARGPWLVRNLAMVYAWTGESDLAIEQLEIVAKIPAGPSYGELRFDPTWDSLQGDPRFEKMLVRLAPKSVPTTEPERR
jgi:serine/threonine protein kinase/cytochrome c-type biogenesis protein CcmH/NrfG